MLKVLSHHEGAEEYSDVKQVGKAKTRERMGKDCTEARGRNESSVQRLMMHHSPSSTDAAVVVLYKAIC